MKFNKIVLVFLFALLLTGCGAGTVSYEKATKTMIETNVDNKLHSDSIESISEYESPENTNIETGCILKSEHELVENSCIDLFFKNQYSVKLSESFAIPELDYLKNSFLVEGTLDDMIKQFIEYNQTEPNEVFYRLLEYVSGDFAIELFIREYGNKETVNKLVYMVEKNNELQILFEVDDDGYEFSAHCFEDGIICFERTTVEFSQNKYYYYYDTDGNHYLLASIQERPLVVSDGEPRFTNLKADEFRNELSCIGHAAWYLIKVEIGEDIYYCIEQFGEDPEAEKISKSIQEHLCQDGSLILEDEIYQYVDDYAKQFDCHFRESLEVTDIFNEIVLDEYSGHFDYEENLENIYGELHEG